MGLFMSYQHGRDAPIFYYVFLIEYVFGRYKEKPNPIFIFFFKLF